LGRFAAPRRFAPWPSEAAQPARVASELELEDIGMSEDFLDPDGKPPPQREGEGLERSARLKDICEPFRARYEDHADASRARETWETLDLPTCVLDRTKIKRERVWATTFLLDQHLLISDTS
jgi:hypothetical protein